MGTNRKIVYTLRPTETQFVDIGTIQEIREEKSDDGSKYFMVIKECKHEISQTEARDLKKIMEDQGIF